MSYWFSMQGAAGMSVYICMWLLYQPFCFCGDWWLYMVLHIFCINCMCKPLPSCLAFHGDSDWAAALGLLQVIAYINAAKTSLAGNVAHALADMHVEQTCSSDVGKGQAQAEHHVYFHMTTWVSSWALHCWPMKPVYMAYWAVLVVRTCLLGVYLGVKVFTTCATSIVVFASASKCIFFVHILLNYARLVMSCKLHTSRATLCFEFLSCCIQLCSFAACFEFP